MRERLSHLASGDDGANADRKGFAPTALAPRLLARRRRRYGRVTARKVEARPFAALRGCDQTGIRRLFLIETHCFQRRVLRKNKKVKASQDDELREECSQDCLLRETSGWRTEKTPFSGMAFPGRGHERLLHKRRRDGIMCLTGAGGLEFCRGDGGGLLLLGAGFRT
jgi:hypothetical protein